MLNDENEIPKCEKPVGVTGKYAALIWNESKAKKSFFT